MLLVHQQRPRLPAPAQDALAEEVSLLLDQLSEDSNSTWVPCSNATVTTEGCLQSVAGGCSGWRSTAAAVPAPAPAGATVHSNSAAAAPARLVLRCLTLAFPASRTARLAGTNYWLRMNISCPDYDFPDTVQLEATIYDPLDNYTRPTVGCAGCAVIIMALWFPGQGETQSPTMQVHHLCASYPQAQARCRSSCTSRNRTSRKCGSSPSDLPHHPSRPTDRPQRGGAAGGPARGL